MAQKVSYGANNVTFEEGPFVVVYTSGWRIEVKLDGHPCPILPHSSIYKLMERWGKRGKFATLEEAEEVCDRLNSMVEGRLKKRNGTWVQTS